MNRMLLLAALAIGAAPATGFAQGPSLDGEWRGVSDGGSCNAPLDYVVFIDSGIVDGSAYDTTAKGPVPNTRKAPPPAPTPGLWQIHGLAKGSAFNLLAVASVKGPVHRDGKLAVRAEGGALVVSETSGCRRTARLTRAG